MKTTERVIALKGSRSYVQGPDIFNAMVDAVGGGASLTEVAFSIHSELGQGHVRILVSADREDFPKMPDRIAWLTGRSGGKQIFASLASLEAEPVIERVTYDDSSIVEACRIEGNRIVQQGGSPVSFAETIVAMQKHLLQNLFPDAPGRWAFTKLELDRIPDRAEQLALEFTHNFGYRLVKSRVSRDFHPVGSIYFTAWNQ